MAKTRVWVAQLTLECGEEFVSVHTSERAAHKQLIKFARRLGIEPWDYTPGGGSTHLENDGDVRSYGVCDYKLRG